MSALDKLNAKANIKSEDQTNKAAKEKQKASAPKKKTAEEPKTETKAAEKKSKSTPAKAPAGKSTSRKNKTSAVKPTPAKQTKGKHPGGRTNTRGQNGKDYKMVNIAVPTDVYELLKEASHGNMTYYINSVLRESVGL